MPRFKNRPLEWTDILDRFKKLPKEDHLHNALALIGRLEDEGTMFSSNDSTQRTRWRTACTELARVLRESGARRHGLKQDLATALKDFMHDFEHASCRISQIIYQDANDPDYEDNKERISDWLNLIFKACIYALTSAWTNTQSYNLA